MARSPVVIFLVVTACAPAPEPEPEGHHADAALTACSKLTTPLLANAGELIAQVNRLPMPVTVPCVLASLKRPLRLVATTSLTSAQPADGPQSPRLFLIGPSMSLSVVASGDGAKLIELGEWVTAKRTVKGELVFPVSAPLDATAAYTHIEQSNGTTTCSLCHRAEGPEENRPGVYASTAFRPEPGHEVSAARVAALHDACVASNEQSERCTFFHALYDFGAVQQGAFSDSVELFIQ